MLETEFLKLKYHNNVESNTDEVDAEEYFNNNYKKIDANAKKQNEDLIKLKEDLQQENTELSSNMPWNTTSGKSLHITDSAKYSKNKLEISGDMEQEKRSGKNLFIPLSTKTISGISIAQNADGTYNITGTATANVNHTAFVDLDKSGIKNGVAYTLSFTKTLTGLSTRVEMYNGEAWLRTLMSSTNSTNNTCTGTANTTNATKIRFGIFVTSGTTVNIQNLGVQLEEGTTATEFEQYGATPSTEFPSMPTVCTGVQKIRQSGKNIFDVNDKISTYTVDEEDWISVSKNNSAGSTASYTNIYTNKSSNLKVNTEYSIVAEIKQVTGEGYIRFVSDASASGFSQFSQEANYNLSNLKSGDIIILKRTSKSDFSNCSIMLRTFLTTSAGKSNSITFRLSVLEDTNITVNNFVYEPYWGKVHTLNLGSIELCKIKDTNGNVVAKDRRVFRNGKWQWEKNIIKIALSSTANWQLQTSWSAVGDKTNAFYIAKPNEVASEKEVACSHFNFVKNIYLYDVEGIYISSSLIIRLPKLVASDVATLKTYLANNTVYAYCVRTTPIYTDCTAEQSTVSDKLYNNFELQKGTNNIIVESSNGVGVNMELTYMQDLQTKLNLLEAMCVSNASQEV